MELEGENGLFMKIVRGELPSHKVYEDNDTYAFLDTGPVRRGHVLVVPKKPFRNVFDINEDAFSAVMRTVQKIAPAIRDAVGAKGVNITINNEPEAGQKVFHLHVHIIPRHNQAELEPWSSQEYGEGEAEILLEKISSRLS